MGILKDIANIIKYGLILLVFTVYISYTYGDELTSSASECTSENIVHPGYGNTNYIGANGHTITLRNNESAQNVTYKELLKFLDKDKTDWKKYEEGNYTCGDYAEDVHNNAEKEGIKAAWVSIDFKNDNVGHACNAFYTTDKGLVFIDCTKADKIVSVEIGKSYIPSRVYSSNVYYDSLGVVSNFEIYW